MPASEHVRALIRESAAVAALHDLNTQRIRAFAERDLGWHEKNLAADFVCTRPDGRRIDKDELVRRTADEPVVDVTCDDIDFRPLGDVALVQGVLHRTRSGVRRSTRYTDVWLRADGRWCIVAEQFTNVAHE